MARPMPRPAPVISTTLSLNLIDSFLIFLFARAPATARPAGGPSSERRRASDIPARHVTRRPIAPVGLAPAQPMRRLAGIADLAPAPFLLRGHREAADEVDHFALGVGEKLPLFLAVEHDPRRLQEVAVVLMPGLPFDIGGDAYFALVVGEDGVAEVVMANHEGAGVPAAVLVHGDERPPDDVLVVVDHQVLLEVDGPTLGHVELRSEEHT